MVRWTLYDTLAFLLLLSLLLPSLLIMFIPSTFKRPVSSWKALNLRKRSEERFSRNAETEIYTLSLHDALPICFPAPVEFIAAVIAYYVHPVNIQTACLIMEGAEFTENIINGVE